MTIVGGDAPKRQIVWNPLPLVGFVLITLALIFGVRGLQRSFRPYVTTIAEATQTDRSIQLVGFLGSTGEYDAAGKFTFQLQDATGALLRVVYAQPKPSNFEQAVSVVAIGRYDPKTQAFLADDMLVKCPSKYQEQAGSRAVT